MPLHIVERHEWEMPPIGSNHDMRSFREIFEANVHHSDTLAPMQHAQCADVVRAFDTAHRKRGWACIGYNRVICTHGYIYQGRPLLMTPAAAEGHNTPIIAYCFISNGNDEATPEQWAAFLDIKAHDEKRMNKHRPRHQQRTLKVTTHREVEPPGYTECPGDGIETQVQQYRRSR